MTRSFRDMLPDLIRIVTAVAALGGASGGSYYLAAEHADQRAVQTTQDRQQEFLGHNVLIADMARRITRLEDQIDRVERRFERRVKREQRTQWHEDEAERSAGGIYAQRKEMP